MDRRADQTNPLLQTSINFRNQTKERGTKRPNFIIRVKRSYSSSTSFVQFCGKFSIIFFETIGWAIITLLLTVPLSMIIVGTLFLHSCPREPYIPIYLIVAGCFGVVKGILNLIQSWVDGCRGHLKQPEVKTNPLAVVLSWFLLAWFITGSVWIYKIYNDFETENEQSSKFCNKNLYLYSFWVTTITYVSAALACFGFCILTSFVLSFDSDASKSSLKDCFGNVVWILYWYFTRYEAVAWPGFKYRGGKESEGIGRGEEISNMVISCAESEFQNV